MFHMSNSKREMKGDRNAVFVYENVVYANCRKNGKKSVARRPENSRFNFELDVEKMLSVKHKMSDSHRVADSSSASLSSDVWDCAFPLVRSENELFPLLLIRCGIVHTSVTHFIRIDVKLSRQWEWEAGQTTHTYWMCICGADVSISHDYCQTEQDTSFG